MTFLLTAFAGQIGDRRGFPPLSDLESIIWPGIALSIFVATACLVDVVIRVAARWSLIDLPNHRSAHSLPTPRGGGTAIMLVMAVGAVVVSLKWGKQAFDIIAGALVPAVLVGIVGLADDIRPINAKLRLLIYVAVGMWMTAVLGPFESLAIEGVSPVSFGVFGWPLTVLWVVGMINAFNFMDGADGMAATCATMAGLMVVVVGGVAWVPPLMVLGAFLAAACGGFLVFNWQPARIFMGDIGSAFLGAFLAAIPLLFKGSERATVLLPLVLGLWPVIFDPLVSVLRRVASGQSPLEPHREFFFHRLVRSGLGHGQVTLVYGGLCAAGTAAGVTVMSEATGFGWDVGMIAFVCGMAVGLVWVTESRCLRHGLAPAGTVTHSPLE